MKNNSDPRTQQFKEVAVFIGGFVIFNLVLLLIGRLSMSLISVGYVFFVVGIVPLAGILLALILRSMRQWH